MNLVAYLMMEVTPLWSEKELSQKKIERKPFSPEARASMARAKFKRTVERFERAFEHFNYEATSLQIGNFLEYNTSSIAKSLADVESRSTYLTHREMTKEEAKQRKIKMSTGNPPFLWTWNKDGKILIE